MCRSSDGCTLRRETSWEGRSDQEDGVTDHLRGRSTNRTGRTRSPNTEGTNRRWRWKQQLRQLNRGSRKSVLASALRTGDRIDRGEEDVCAPTAANRGSQLRQSLRFTMATIDAATLPRSEQLNA